MLSERLKLIASLIGKGERVADIGTDHAYLPVWLVAQGICPSAIACDLREGPLENAGRAVAEAGFSSVIDCRLGDGLQPITAGEVDDIAIAGMGGETIAAILEACTWAKNRALHYVFQPMSRSEELRRYLLTNGYRIVSEQTVCEGGHWYVCMDAVWEDTPPIVDEAAYVIGGLSATADREWLLLRQAVLKKRYNGQLRSGDREELDRLRAILKKLEEFLS